MNVVWARARGQRESKAGEESGRIRMCACTAAGQGQAGTGGFLKPRKAQSDSEDRSLIGETSRADTSSSHLCPEAGVGQAVTWSPDGKGVLLFWAEKGILQTMTPGIPAPGGRGVWTESGNPESHSRAKVMQRTAVPKCIPGHHAWQEVPGPCTDRECGPTMDTVGRGEPVGKG